MPKILGHCVSLCERVYWATLDLAEAFFDSEALDPEPVGYADLGDCALPDVFRPGRGKT